MSTSLRRLHLASRALDIGRPIVTIGNFDGLHRGHQRILAETVATARDRGEKAVAVTFEPHPVKLFHPESTFCRLKTLDQRRRDFAQMGIDVVALIRFDEELRATSPQRFVEEILGRIIRASEILVGPQFRFGHRRQGDSAMLRSLGKELDFRARSIRPSLSAGRPVSSTRIRQALAAGHVGLAERLLGRPFAVVGTVVTGARRGRKLGFPTANLAPDNECIPATGVYATRVKRRGRSYCGATFIGEAATFGKLDRVFETHLLDYPGRDLYGAKLEVEFIARLRGQEKFPSPAALVAQIERDVAAARRLVSLS